MTVTKETNYSDGDQTDVSQRLEKRRKNESRSVLSNSLDPMDYRVHGILQARIQEWVAYPFSSGSSPPRNWTGISCIASGFFTNWTTGEAQGRGDGVSIKKYHFWGEGWWNSSILNAVVATRIYTCVTTHKVCIPIKTMFWFCKSNLNIFIIASHNMEVGQGKKITQLFLLYRDCSNKQV